MISNAVVKSCYPSGKPKQDLILKSLQIFLLLGLITTRELFVTTNERFNVTLLLIATQILNYHCILLFHNCTNCSSLHLSLLLALHISLHK